MDRVWPFVALGLGLLGILGHLSLTGREDRADGGETKPAGADTPTQSAAEAARQALTPPAP